MNFLEICQKTRELAAISGVGPSTTVGQSGEMSRIVNWVAQSWLEIQGLHKTWNFLAKDFSFTTMEGKGDYTLAEAGVPDLMLWDKYSLRCQRTDLGFVNRQFMEDWDFVPFRDTYRFNNMVQGRPIRFAIDPKDKSILIAAIPNGEGFTVTGRYWSKPVAFVNDYSVPAMPDQHHMLIAYWALSKYAGYEAATEAKQEAMENKPRLLTMLENDQLPEITLG